MSDGEAFGKEELAPDYFLLFAQHQNPPSENHEGQGGKLGTENLDEALAAWLKVGSKSGVISQLAVALN